MYGLEENGITETDLVYCHFQGFSGPFSRSFYLWTLRMDRSILGIISNLNDAPPKKKLFRLSLNPLSPLKRPKNIHIWHHLLFGIKHKGIKGFKQNVLRDIHL